MAQEMQVPPNLIWTDIITSFHSHLAGFPIGRRSQWELDDIASDECQGEPRASEIDGSGSNLWFRLASVNNMQLCHSCGDVMNSIDPNYFSSFIDLWMPPTPSPVLPHPPFPHPSERSPPALGLSCPPSLTPSIALLCRPRDLSWLSWPHQRALGPATV